ncbi:MAG: trigger factor [Actinomycetia bacterium]|nr:trigger factor [Actinomycetes bacterium]
MEVKTEELEKNRVKLEIEVPVDKVEKEIKGMYKEVSKKVTIPGFRKGKVPKEVLDVQVGKEEIRKEALEKMMPIFYEKAIKDNKVKVIDKPKLDVVQFEEGKSLVFKAEVEVKPEIKVKKYKNIEVEMPKVKIAKTEIDSQIESLRERFGKLEVVEGRKVKDGDFVILSFQGFLDGKQVEKASSNDYLLELGKGMFLPDFEKNIMGALKGEIRDFGVKFPENYLDKDFQGKNIRFKVIVKEIKVKKLPEVDDKFASEAGGYASLKELKEDIKKKLLESKERMLDGEFERKVIQKITEEAKFEAPEILIMREAKGMLFDYVYSLGAQNINFEDYLKARGKNVDGVINEFKPEAESRVKTTLTLEAIADLESIEVSEDEFEGEIEAIALQTKKPKEEVRKMLKEKGSLGLVKYDIKLKKTINFIVANAKKIEKDDKIEKKGGKKDK